MLDSDGNVIGYSYKNPDWTSGEGETITSSTLMGICKSIVERLESD